MELSRNSFCTSSKRFITARTFHHTPAYCERKASLLRLLLSSLTLLRVGSLLSACVEIFCIVAEKEPSDAGGAVVVVPQGAVEDEVEEARFRFFEGVHFVFLGIQSLP